MGRAFRILATTGFASMMILTGCNGNDLPTNPNKPSPTPMPIPTAQPTPAPAQIADAFAVKIDNVFKGAIANWQTQSSIQSAVVNGSACEATPGTVSGPSLGSFMSAQMVSVPASVTERAILNAFQTALVNGFATWQSTYTVTLTYPGFDSVQAPQAPATANWPQALKSGTADEAAFKSDALAAAVRAAVSPLGSTESLSVDAAATKLAARFQSFKNGTTIRNVIGSGPVPSYDPPFVPAGPVVNGTASGAAGNVFKSN